MSTHVDAVPNMLASIRSQLDVITTLLQSPAPSLPPRAEAIGTYTMAEVSRLLRIGRSSVYEAARTGVFPTIRIGNRIVAPKAAIDRMLS